MTGIRLADYVNAAGILASDMPYTVVMKLQAAIDAAAALDHPDAEPAAAVTPAPFPMPLPWCPPEHLLPASQAGRATSPPSQTP